MAGDIVPSPGEGWTCPEHGDVYLRPDRDEDDDLVRGATSCDACKRHSWDTLCPHCGGEFADAAHVMIGTTPTCTSASWKR